MMRRFAACWPLALLIAVPLVTYWPALRGEVLLGPGDALLMFMPLRMWAAEAWLAGGVPTWEAGIFSGFPTLAGMTSGVFFPFNALYLLCAPTTAMNALVLVASVAGALGTYGYCRAAGCTRAGAVFAGLTFSGCGFVVVRIGNTPVADATAWLPLLLLALERLRAEVRPRWVVLGAGAVALALSAGHPQVPAYTLGVGAAYAAWRAAGAAPPAGRVRYLVAAAAALVGGMLLMAPQLLPTAELARQSLRDRLPFEAFVELALPPSGLAQLLFPQLDAARVASTADVSYIGVLEQAGYVGVPGLMLAVAALAALRRSPIVAFWGVVATLSLLMVLGDATPLARLAYHVPVYNLFRICARNFFQFDLAVAVLAGFGLTRLQHRLGRGAAVAAALAVLAGMTVFAAGAAVPAGAIVVLVLPLLLAGVAAALLLGLARRPGNALVAALVSLQGVDLFLYAHQVEMNLPRIDAVFTRPGWLAPALATAGDGRTVSVVAGGVAPTDYRPALWGLRLIQGYDSLLMRRYAEFVGDMDYAGRIQPAQLVGAPLFLDLLSTRALVLTFPQAPAAAVEAGGARFAYPQLDIALAPGQGLEFSLPSPQYTTAIAAMSFLGNGADVGDDEPVARIELFDAAGTKEVGELRAGAHTAEWAWDRADVASIVRHRRAPVAEQFDMNGTPANVYVGSVALAAPLAAVRVRIENPQPRATLQLSRVSLLGADGRVHPLSVAHLLRDQPQRWRRMAQLRLREPLETAPPLLGAAWLRPLVRVRPAVPPRAAGADPAAGGDDVEVYENLQALPHAWFVQRTLAVDGAAALSSVRSGRLPDGEPFDPRAVALVEDAPGRDVGPPDPAAHAEVVASAPRRLEIATRSTVDGFLVVSELAYPGWQATVDGAPVSILRTNGVLRGLAVPAGAHRVVFEHHPQSLRLGLALAALTVLTFCGGALWAWLRRGRGAGRPRRGA